MSEAVFVEGLTKTYVGKTVVNHLDFSVKKRNGIRTARCQRCRKKHYNRMYARHKTGR